MLESEVLNRLFLTVAILGLVVISFTVGTSFAPGKEANSAGETSFKIDLPEGTQLTGSEGDVKGDQETQLTFETEPSLTSYSTYIYEPDYSQLIGNLKGENQYIKNDRGLDWYNSEKTKIEEEHNNKSQSLFKYYIDIIQHYEFLISQASSSSEAEIYTQKSKEAADEYEAAKQRENADYQGELTNLESKWQWFQSRLQTIQELIKRLEAGNKPDNDFWNLYYQYPPQY